MIALMRMDQSIEAIYKLCALIALLGLASPRDNTLLLTLSFAHRFDAYIEKLLSTPFRTFEHIHASFLYSGGRYGVVYVSESACGLGRQLWASSERAELVLDSNCWDLGTCPSCLQTDPLGYQE